MDKLPGVFAKNGVWRRTACRTATVVAAVAFATISGEALAASAELPIDRQASYEATVYRTDGGIPHIVAADHGSLGFGTGYACLLYTSPSPRD